MERWLMGALPSARPHTCSTRCVFRWWTARIRTNIEIDQASVSAAMDRSGVHTRTAAVSGS
ncbi:MAG: type II toxin-antitoxin system VapB family antitoxin [Acidobacteria bacterium]|nr:type II toxin-antitoxin system VapB family antitoxin [Acidobacteriota bacterium]